MPTGYSSLLCEHRRTVWFQPNRRITMRRSIFAALIAALLISGTALAVPPAPSGTLTITSLDAQFGGAVTFSATTDNLKGYQYLLVYLACYQGATLVYGQLALPTETF